MNTEKLEQLIIESIQEIAPEIELNDIDFDEDIREECDLDSMDFINYLEALKKASGINIAEADYAQLYTFNHTLAFLQAQTHNDH